ncbi:hypothetical protein KIN20_028864 [Parelaphostrongylus tenuis]|uniref:Uncharacterized protein n=1 Tax=Parelaphostrongylus tenuis TaxID=148309 RepID=A0AAD5R1R6_PARTN|nr:hypothetical protein KIN20_028864 [Parelaphostrongylus tenuis]
MSDDYKAVRGGTLKLKEGKKCLFKADKKRKHKLRKDEENKFDPDADVHGGWWKITDEVDLRGGEHVSFECGNGNGCYLSALDNGRFTIGMPHQRGSEPNPEEIFAVVKTPDDPKSSFKTGYGKYIGVDADGSLVATAEAIGQRERFQVVFEEGKKCYSSSMQSVILINGC